MKNRKVEIAFFLIGLGIFAYLVDQFGVGRIGEYIQRAGWSLLYAIITWLFIYLLNTTAWRLTLGEEGKQIGFAYLFLVTVSGFVLNYITPVVSLGGEPYKVKKLAAAMGARHSLSAVVLYRMVHLLGHMLLLLTGILSALLFLPLTVPTIVPLILAALIIISIITVTFAGHRKGVFQWFHGFISRIPLLRKRAASLLQYQSALAEMDAALTDAYRRRRRSLYLSIAAEFSARTLMGVEMYLVMAGVGVSISPLGALFLYTMYSIIINTLFFVPMSLGSREGGIYLGLESLSMTPVMGIYFGIVIRIREFFWILIGLLFILLTSDKKQAAPISSGTV